MEIFTLNFPAKAALPTKTITGVVGSGDMEVLYFPENSGNLAVSIETSVDGLQKVWTNVFARLSEQRELPAGKLVIHDFGATPGVIKLRVEQCFYNAAEQTKTAETIDEQQSFIELNARSRAKALLDQGSYRELLDPYDNVTSQWLEKQNIVISADDGMVIAKGTIQGKNVVIAAVEGVFQGGSMGEVSGAKMAAALELAAEDNRNGKPTSVVLLLETGGVRLQEANLGLAAIADIHAAIVDMKRYAPVIGITTGTVGCFGGMSIAAALCTSLIVTKEARLGLNGPQVIEQEAGIEEYDSRNRPFIWSFTGGEARYRNGLVDALVDDSIQQVRDALTKQLNSGHNDSARLQQIDYYLNKLNAVDTTKQITPEGVTAVFGLEDR
ncbi:biotin-independent malonate decarboxylase subunit beta [Zophobihabitans entericus]|uniref:Malonate decarboxylase acyl carrier protein n=1 Tax=Zophobihabitans entericus TaxID=1635327 RepID=A0A6G9I9L9_9GAMM|nr:biotin-independent malonate decarboxylase subunit beta [Zophobihabitans entericus]QIQ20522.1 biotin-independent malonate decarboxylase subunit beta [Zophobihabitans entericus]